jgi:hypothetical protein
MALTFSFLNFRCLGFFIAHPDMAMWVTPKLALASRNLLFLKQSQRIGRVNIWWPMQGYD